MIEKDLKVIRKTQSITRTKTAQELKTLGRRLSKHDKQFQAITSAINLLPTQDVITKTIQDTIKIVVNGKIDKIDSKVDLVGEHLKAQDETATKQGNDIKDLSKKIAPVTAIQLFIGVLWQSVLGAGAFSAAVWAIIKLFKIKI